MTFDELVLAAERAVPSLAAYAELDSLDLSSVWTMNRLFKIQGSFMSLERLRNVLVKRGAVPDGEHLSFPDVVRYAAGLRIRDVREIAVPETGSDLIVTVVGLIIEDEFCGR